MQHAEDMAVNRGDDEPFPEDEVDDETRYTLDDDALCDLMEEEEIVYESAAAEFAEFLGGFYPAGSAFARHMLGRRAHPFTSAAAPAPSAPEAEDYD